MFSELGWCTAVHLRCCCLLFIFNRCSNSIVKYGCNNRQIYSCLLILWVTFNRAFSRAIIKALNNLLRTYEHINIIHKYKTHFNLKGFHLLEIICAILLMQIKGMIVGKRNEFKKYKSGFQTKMMIIWW